LSRTKSAESHQEKKGEIKFISVFLDYGASEKIEEQKEIEK